MTSSHFYKKSFRFKLLILVMTLLLGLRFFAKRFCQWKLHTRFFQNAINYCNAIALIISYKTLKFTPLLTILCQTNADVIKKLGQKLFFHFLRKLLWFLSYGVNLSFVTSFLKISDTGKFTIKRFGAPVVPQIFFLVTCR